MVISRKTDYGLILIGALKATYASGKFVSLRTIVQQYRLPYAYIEKLAGQLKRAGILEAHTGKVGGYRLARNPKTLSGGAIVDTFQQEPMMRCLHAQHPQKACALVFTCPTRKGWNKIERKVSETLNHITVAQL